MNNKIKVIGSGRTDAGVHANEQSAHFTTPKKIIYKEKFISSINYFLKNYPIAILSLKKRPKGFHARHSANNRTYKYFIISGVS